MSNFDRYPTGDPEMNRIVPKINRPSNPFPNIKGTTPLWTNSGTCFSRVLYATEEEARKVAGVVRASGATANGGYMHGMPLGTVTKVPGGWEVTY